MSAEVMLQVPKIWKKSLILFGFQFLAGLLMGVLVLILTYVVKVSPQAWSTHISSMPATILGACFYGYWQEKHSPGILESQLIKKICKTMIFWQFSIILICMFLVFIIQPKNLSFEFVVTTAFFLVLAFLVYYWITYMFVMRGIAVRQKIAIKLNQVKN